MIRQLDNNVGLNYEVAISFMNFSLIGNWPFYGFAWFKKALSKI